MEAHRPRSWIAAATDRAILGRSAVTCLIVGALLTAINHGDQLLRGEFNTAMAWQVGLTFLVPFVVATTSGAAAMRARDGDDPVNEDDRADEAQNGDMDADPQRTRGQ